MAGSICNLYFVLPIKKAEAKPWLLEKHYAKRIPSIIHAFGLYDQNNELQGVCVFGNPCRMLTEYWGNILELVRLVVNEGLPKNALSFFVSRCLKLLPKPCAVVSYADANQNHHGYIYQATNWVYTGLSSSENNIYVNGILVHRRSLNAAFGTSSVSCLLESGLDVEVEEQAGKYRYFMFLGNKKQVRELKNKLPYEVLPYPKGNNIRYDASGSMSVQGLLL